MRQVKVYLTTCKSKGHTSTCYYCTVNSQFLRINVLDNIKTIWNSFKNPTGGGTKILMLFQCNYNSLD